MREAYPLTWPDDWGRTPYSRRQQSRFRQTFGKARDFLLSEVRRLGGREIILSTNIPLRNDGLPYSNWREPSDPGVAIYFTYKKSVMSFACDQYVKVVDNLYAIGLTIECLRAIERYGASDMMERAFRGFSALPAAGWRSILGVSSSVTLEEAEHAFRVKCHKGHPDKGGNMDMSVLVQARDEARRELGQR
jgi:hypothetical protein